MPRQDAPVGPHQGQPVRHAGAPLAGARAAMILVHGRGATAESILSLGPPLGGDGVAYLAPAAAGNTWYPLSFLAPLERNEPGLSSGLAALRDLVARVEAAGVPSDRLFLVGFSQGACLALEFAARHARRYGGVVGFSGGLIGPDGTPREYAGSLDGTPVFLGCGDVDSHIPAARVRESAAVLARLGGAVDARLYPAIGHTIVQDELDRAAALVATALGRDRQR